MRLHRGSWCLQKFAVGSAAIGKVLICGIGVSVGVFVDRAAPDVSTRSLMVV
jgi:hypothetical protein